ncbi:MAG: DNA primase [Bacteroides sp.]|nr:MAG: DNA primase [Bacteroides sp.]
MLDKESINTLITKINILDIVEDFCNLKQYGDNFLGLCPFHDEKHPSFNVNVKKNIFKCFGCGKGGNAIDFIILYKKFSYIEAIEFLSKKYNINVFKHIKKDDNNYKSVLLLINHYINAYLLNKMEDKSKNFDKGINFLYNRQISLNTIKKFQISYSTNNDVKNLLNFLINKGFNKDYIYDIGFVCKKYNGMLYNKFHDRVIFPIHSLSGNIVGFGGRTLLSKHNIKYINSSDSRIFSKKENLYGIFFTKNYIRNLDHCFLVEGYIDVISLYQNQIYNVVATLGTNISIKQIELIKKYTNNITLLYDGDTTGINSAIKNIDIMLQCDMDLSIVVLPNNQDPDSYINLVGNKLFINFIDNNKLDFLHFKYYQLIKKNEIKINIQSESIKSIINSISYVNDNIKRDLYINTASQLLNINKDVIVNELNKCILNRNKAGFNQNNIKNNNDILFKSEIKLKNSIYEYEILKIIIQYGNMPFKNNSLLRHYIIESIKNIDFKNKVILLIINSIKIKYYNDQFIDMKFYLSFNDTNIINIVNSILNKKSNISNKWNEKYEIKQNIKIKDLLKYINDIINRLLLCNILFDIYNISDELFNCINKIKIVDLQKKYLELNNQKNKIAKKLGISILNSI